MSTWRHLDSHSRRPRPARPGRSVRHGIDPVKVRTVDPWPSTSSTRPQSSPCPEPGGTPLRTPASSRSLSGSTQDFGTSIPCRPLNRTRTTRPADSADLLRGRPRRRHPSQDRQSAAGALARAVSVAESSCLSRGARPIHGVAHSGRQQCHGTTDPGRPCQPLIGGDEAGPEKFGQGHVHGVVGGDGVAEVERPVEERLVRMPVGG